MKNMRPVDMDLDSLHIFGIDVARDIGTLVNNKDLFTGLRRFSGEHRPVQSRADNQIIIHELFLHVLCSCFLCSQGCFSINHLSENRKSQARSDVLWLLTGYEPSRFSGGFCLTESGPGRILSPQESS